MEKLICQIQNQTLTLNTTSSRKSNCDRRARPFQPNNNCRSILLLQIRQRGKLLFSRFFSKKKNKTSTPNKNPILNIWFPQLALPLHRFAMHQIPRGCGRAARAMELQRFHGLERAGGEVHPASDTIAIGYCKSSAILLCGMEYCYRRDGHISFLFSYYGGVFFFQR